MLPRPTSSLRRYRDYLAKRKAHTNDAQDSPDRKGADKLRRNRSFFAIFREFWTLLGEHRPTVFAALATLSTVTLIGLAIPASTKVALDYILTDHPGPSGLPAFVRDRLAIPSDPALVPPQLRERLLWELGALMIALAILGVSLGTWGRFQMTRLTKRVQIKLRHLAFDHAARLPLYRIHQHKSGGMASILRDDASQAGDLLFSMIYNPWRAVVQLVGTLIILAAVDWRMLAGAFALLPATWITHKTWISRIRPVYRDIKHVRQGIDAATTEAFGGMRVVRGFGKERAEIVRFGLAQHLMARQEILVWRWSRTIEVAWAVLIPFASSAVLVYGGKQVIRGTLTIGDVMMFSTYLLMLLGPLETLTSTAANIQGNLAGFDRVLDLLNEPEEFADSSPADARKISRQEARGEIELRDVSFSYPKPKAKPAATTASRATPVPTNFPHPPHLNGALVPSTADRPPEPVLQHISLHVRAGQTIALVGPSGSGKTTLCNLIARFYDPTLGSIFFDHTDLRQINVHSYRRLLGIVEQDVFLFDGTVAENIAYSNRDATFDQIQLAAVNANAADFIEKLDKGYDTIIGERGVRLSGGQKQRLAIARALLADPVVLILDEATSNLDAESEAAIQQSLARLMKGRTCFVIAHRLSTIRHADRIVVLDHGRVQEIGAHDELLARGGRYADLLRAQLEGRPITDTGSYVR
jgi:ATP-binding cassette subfamily B protein/subfamily B ATP-binding cassette protein MsbA